MDAAKEWPKILGLSEGDTVTEKVIETQYRMQAKKLHPDVGGTVEDMQQLNIAKDLGLKWVERERAKQLKPLPAMNPYQDLRPHQMAQASHQSSMYASMASNFQSSSSSFFSGINGAGSLGSMYGHAIPMPPKTASAEVKRSWVGNFFREKIRGI